ncbi:NAD(P)/FAD-dependent oxidoreductase [Bordetella sp. 2513F-2]
MSTSSPETPGIRAVVIVGAGQAGAAAAAALRAQGYAGRLTVVGSEPHAPYERPPLSKAVLQGEAGHEGLAVHPAEFYAQQQVDLITHTRAVALDRTARLLRLADGRELAYDRLLLATGGSARELPSLPRGAASVHYIRTLDDALALRAVLQPGVRLAVVGGGFLGLEVASTASALGAEVQVIESAPRLLERALPEALSAWLAARAASWGVRLHLGRTLAEAAGTTPRTLRLDDGTSITADVVVVAIGLVPEVALARDAGLPLDSNGGIRVDGQARTADPAIYAAGDCASQPRSCLGAPARLESWQNANEQARLAAAAMLGQALPAEPYPWFWTDQYGCNVQMLGLPEPGLVYVCRDTGNAEAPRQIWLGLRHDVPRHGIAVNAGGDLRQLRPLFERSMPLEAARFADGGNPIKPLVKGWLARA